MMIKGNKWEGVRKVNISGVSMSGTMAAAPVDPAAPKQNPSPRGQAAQDAAANSTQVKQMVDEMQSQINSMNVSLQFTPYGKHDEKIAIVVANKDTGKVIREIPPKELQHLYAKMSELAGMILNKNA